jgi:GNAT superfamily N-acetyltransferase
VDNQGGSGPESAVSGSAKDFQLTWQIERRRDQDHQVEQMLAGYLAELHTVMPDFVPDDASPTAPIDVHLPIGFFLLVMVGEEPVACGVLRYLSEHSGELRRMWVKPMWRGRGIAKYLLGELEELARELGLAELFLDTNRGLTPAIQLYRSTGYREIPCYNDNQFADYWFAKNL